MSPHPLTTDARRLTPDWLADQARQRPTAPAVITRVASLTYAELDARATALAETLTSAGVAPGEPIGARLSLTLDSVVGVHAMARVGAVLVPLNLRLTPEETAELTEAQWECIDSPTGKRLYRRTEPDQKSSPSTSVNTAAKSADG